MLHKTFRFLRKPAKGDVALVLHLGAINCCWKRGWREKQWSFNCGKQCIKHDGPRAFMFVWWINVIAQMWFFFPPSASIFRDLHRTMKSHGSCTTCFFFHCTVSHFPQSTTLTLHSLLLHLRHSQSVYGDEFFKMLASALPLSCANLRCTEKQMDGNSST